MADAIVTLPLDHLQPAHLPGAGRSLSGHQHRRGALLSLAGTAAAPAQATAPDPVLALVARYDDLERQGSALLLVGDEDGGGVLLDLAWRAADEAIATSPTSMDGLVAQLRIQAERLSLGTRGRERDGGDAYTLMRHAEALAGRAQA